MGLLGLVAAAGLGDTIMRGGPDDADTDAEGVDATSNDATSNDAHAHDADDLITHPDLMTADGGAQGTESGDHGAELGAMSDDRLDDALPPVDPASRTVADTDTPAQTDGPTQTDGTGAPGAMGAFNPNPDPWDEGLYISTDEPDPAPPNYYVEVGDHGGNDTGGAGNDTLLGGLGNDWLMGLDGDDSLSGGNGDDHLDGGRGDDTLLGGAGDDTLISGGGRGLLDGGTGNDSLIGGSDAETLIGSEGDDTLDSGGGDDLLTGGAGSDLLMGGDGNDTLDGATDDPSGADFLNGGAGDDRIVLGAGDWANGGDGADRFVLGDWIDPENPAMIDDFSESDHLVISYDPTGPDPVLTTEFDSDTGLTRVLLNGALVANVSAGAAITINQIVFEQSDPSA